MHREILYLTLFLTVSFTLANPHHHGKHESEAIESNPGNSFDVDNNAKFFFNNNKPSPLTALFDFLLGRTTTTSSPATEATTTASSTTEAPTDPPTP